MEGGQRFEADDQKLSDGTPGTIAGARVSTQAFAASLREGAFSASPSGNGRNGRAAALTLTPPAL